jgi:hypothetical protein
MNELHSAQLNELFAALANAQDEFPRVTKGAKSHYGKYAKAADILNPLWPTLKKYGLSVHEVPLVNLEHGLMILQVRLNHSSGQFTTAQCIIRPKSDEDNVWGSSVTFRRKYLYKGILGLAEEEEVQDPPITVTQLQELVAEASKGTNSDELWKAIKEKSKIDNPRQLYAADFEDVKKYIIQNRK